MARPSVQPGAVIDGFTIGECIHRGGMATRTCQNRRECTEADVGGSDVRLSAFSQQFQPATPLFVTVRAVTMAGARARRRCSNLHAFGGWKLKLRSQC